MLFSSKTNNLPLKLVIAVGVDFKIIKSLVQSNILYLPGLDLKIWLDASLILSLEQSAANK